MYLGSYRECRSPNKGLCRDDLATDLTCIDIGILITTPAAGMPTQPARVMTENWSVVNRIGKRSSTTFSYCRIISKIQREFILERTLYCRIVVQSSFAT